jgi:hypothetical protein
MDTPNNKNNKKKKNPDDDIQDLMQSAMMKYMVEQLSYEKQIEKENKTNIETLAPIMNEYLSNYIVIGHDVMGNEIMFSFAKNQNDKNAIIKLFNDMFIKHMMNQTRDGF